MSCLGTVLPPLFGSRGLFVFGFRLLAKLDSFRFLPPFFAVKDPLLPVRLRFSTTPFIMFTSNSKTLSHRLPPFFAFIFLTPPISLTLAFIIGWR